MEKLSKQELDRMSDLLFDIESNPWVEREEEYQAVKKVLLLLAKSLGVEPKDYR